VTPEQFARLKIVFQEALEQPSAVRRAWLREVVLWPLLPFQLWAAGRKSWRP